MSSSKADARFTRRCDEERGFETPSDDGSMTSDDWVDSLYAPARGSLERHAGYGQWMETNYVQVEEFYAEFKSMGRMYWGGAFFQCGNIGDFALMLFKHTQPGATKSKQTAR